MEASFSLASTPREPTRRKWCRVASLLSDQSQPPESGGGGTQTPQGEEWQGHGVLDRGGCSVFEKYELPHITGFPAPSDLSETSFSVSPGPTHLSIYGLEITSYLKTSPQEGVFLFSEAPLYFFFF